MDHREIEERDLVERYLQDRLKGEEATAFEAHLLECGKCFESPEAAGGAVLGRFPFRVLQADP